MRSVVLMSLAVWLLGCAGGGSSKPELTQYLLRSQSPAASGASASLTDVGLRRVRVARYLDQNGVVVETGPGELRAARYHEWAEPLPDGLRRFLRAEIAAELGHEIDVDASRQHDWRLTVDIDVDEFHGTLSGTARLNASWTLTNAEGDLVGAFRFVESESLARSGYGGLVEAQSALVTRLGRAVGRSIRDADPDSGAS